MWNFFDGAVCFRTMDGLHPNLPRASDIWQAIINKDRFLRVHA